MDNELSRRKFLSRAIGLIGALITAGFGVPAVAYLLGTTRQRGHVQTWVPLGAASKVEVGTPALFKASVERTTGWVTQTDELSVYVITDNGRDYVALSNVCTHLGCRVRWVAEQDTFFCPCHNATFDAQGEVLSGPPPRPLDRFAVRVEEGQLQMQWDA